MKYPKLCETKKLHYGAYLYKIVLYNEISTIFRTELQKQGTLSHARQVLEEYKKDFDAGRPIYKYKFRTRFLVTYEVFREAYELYKLMLDMEDYKVRVDPYGSLIIYSNNLEDLEKVCDTVSVRELWKPSDDAIKILLSRDNIIVCDEPVTLSYKVTLNRSRIGSTNELAKWLKNNTDKSKVGKRALMMFEQDLYVDGLYFYVRDEKVLMLIEMMVGNKIRRVDKLIYKGNIDKY